MSVRVDADGDQLSRTTNPSGDHTICFWTRRRGTGSGGFEALIWLGANSSSLSTSEALYYDVSNTQLQWWAGNESAARIDANFTFTTDQWEFIAIVARGATGSACEIFSGDLTTLCVSLGTGTRGADGALGSTFILMGDSGFTAEWWNGAYANLLIYDSILTLEQIRAIQYETFPVQGRPWLWWPLWDDSTAGLADWSGNARGATEGGTLVNEQHPPIVFGDLAYGWSTVAAGGGPVTEIIGNAVFDLDGTQQALNAIQTFLSANGVFDLDGLQQALSVNQTFAIDPATFVFNRESLSANQSFITIEASFEWTGENVLNALSITIPEAIFEWNGEAFIEVQTTILAIGNAIFDWQGEAVFDISGGGVPISWGNIYRNLPELPPPKIAFELHDIDRDTPNVLP